MSRKISKNEKIIRYIFELRDCVDEHTGLVPSVRDVKELNCLYQKLSNVGVKWHDACMMAGGMSTRDFKRIRKIANDRNEGHLFIPEPKKKKQKAKVRKNGKNITIVVNDKDCEKCIYLDRNKFCCFPDGVCVKQHEAKTKYYGTFG